MATIDWPAGLIPQAAQLVLRKAGVQFASPFNGTLQSVDFVAERWTLSASLAAQQARDPNGVHAFCNNLAGGVERVRVWPFHTGGVPRGKLRGAPALGAPAARGDTTLTIVRGRVAPNLLVYPERLDLAPWSGSVTVVSNTHVAPDTFMTADTITDDSTTVTEDRLQNVAIPADTQTYTGSVWVRKTTGGTSKTFAMYLFASGGTPVGNTFRINTDTGAVLGGAGTVVDDGDYWRMRASFTNNGTNTTVAVGLNPAFGNHNSGVNDVTQTGSAVVWSPYLEPGTTASPYLAHPTLEAGDFIGCGGQLLQVASSLQLTDGFGVVPLVNRVRSTIAIDTPVVWYRPTCEMVLPAMQAGPVHRPGVIESTALDLVEVW